MDNKIIERIELNTDAGKYIKCNGCGRLSPEQKYCKYCFSQLSEGGNAEVKSIYITRGKNYSPVADFSRMREKIDSEFRANEIDFSTVGMTEEEYNLKFTPPVLTSREEYHAGVNEKFDAVYKRYEKKATEAYNARKEQDQLMRNGRESIKQIISDTPVQTVFTASVPAKTEQAPETAPAVATAIGEGASRSKPRHENGENLTVRRESSRFKLSFLSVACFVMNLLIISTLFIEVAGRAFGMDILSLLPSALGAQIRENAWLTAAAENQTPFIFTSAAYMLLAGISLYQFFSFSVSVISDKKQKNYAEFVLSFTALLAGVVMLFSLLLSGFALTAFAAGAVILFVATVIHFICATGKMLRD